MSDRKYRQRGYQDTDRRESRPAPPRREPTPYDPRIPRDPRAPNMPGFRQVFRCARCGHISDVDVASRSVCHCGVALHACIQCTSFDPSAVFECRQTITVRVSPKDTDNSCPSFSPRVQVERETGSTAPTTARKAFDDLFKF